MALLVLRNAVSEFRATMFEGGGLEAIYHHVRNIVTASIVMAAGLYAIRRGQLLHLVGVYESVIAGSVVAAVGAVLFVLNLLDGLHRLAKLKRHFIWQIVLVLLYVMITVRIAQLILTFRAG